MAKADRGRFARLALNFAVAGVFLWLAARHVEGKALRAALVSTRAAGVGLALGLFLLGYTCRIARWRAMLQPDHAHLGWGRLGAAFYTSIAINNVLPFRAGDIYRVFGLSRVIGVPVARLLATLLVERLLDLLSLDVALGLALALGAQGTGLSFGGEALLGAGAVLLALLLAPRRFEPLARALLKGLGLVAPGVAARLGDFSAHVFEALHQMAQGPRMLRLLGWSALAWSCEGGVFYAIARALPAMSEPRGALLAFPVGTLATILPSTPGYVGTFDFFVIRAAQALGNSAQGAAAFALVVHLVLWLPATLIGGLCLATGAAGRINKERDDEPQA